MIGGAGGRDEHVDIGDRAQAQRAGAGNWSPRRAGRPSRRRRSWTV
ncbi:hypothetical protein NKH77_55265 [Streptomyces sp. M19]